MARCPYRALHLCHQDASKKEVDRGTQTPSLCLQTNIYEKFMVIRVKKKGLMVYFNRTGRIFTPDRQGTGKNQLSVEDCRYSHSENIPTLFYHEFERFVEDPRGTQ